MKTLNHNLLSTRVGGWKQHVQNAMGHKLYVRLVDANLRESSSQLAIHSRLQTFPRLYDSTMPNTLISWTLGSTNGNVARSQRW